MKKLIEAIRELFGNNIEINKISKVVIDTRLVGEDDLFIGINKGNEYIEEALSKGAGLVITENKSWNNHPKVIVVENSIRAMQDLARIYRKKLDIKIIGVTGSEGKTTTKDIIHGVLSSRYKTKKTKGNYNNHLGLPLSIFSLTEEDEIGVLEMGMSNFGEIKVLCEIANIDYGVITNIGDSHLEFMINRDNVFIEKSTIKNYVDSKNLFIFGDDIYLKDLNGNKIGYNNINDYKINDYIETIDGVEFSLNQEKYKFKLNGYHNGLNASFGVAIGKSFGLTREEIQKGLDGAEVSPMRFEKIQKEEKLFINDAYNASPVSMMASITTFEKIMTTKSKLAILGDMGELGKDEIRYHREILDYINKSEIDNVIITGKLMTVANKEVENSRIIVCETKEEIKKLIKNKFSKDVILLKSSNSSRLWEVIE